MARTVFVRGNRRTGPGEDMLRLSIFVATAVVVGMALLLFDDVDAGLPIVSIGVWVVMLLAVALLLMRSHARRRHRQSPVRERRPSRRTFAARISRERQKRLPRY